MPRRGGFSKVDGRVIENTPEKLRIEIDQIFKQFLHSEDTEYSFPCDLNNLQRKYIHDKAKKLNLISKSYGKEPNRSLRITKKSVYLNKQMFFMYLTKESQDCLNNFLSKPECQNFQPFKQPIIKTEKTFGKLPYGLPTPVVPPETPAHLVRFRNSLPIKSMHDEIINTIRSNQVVIISSETGSGKSTQIPQYILDDCLKRGENCKIVCAQPRRISAVSVAERVAEERGHTIGTSVGYHIKLESKVSNNSNLIYVTNGVLVRTVIFGPDALNSYTHIIIDEVHERDKLTDFLLICLREALRINVKVKLILMSATLNVQNFADYFGDVKVIQVPGRLFTITEYFLDEIIPMVNYKTDNMLRKLKRIDDDSIINSVVSLSINSDDPGYVVLPEIDNSIDEVLRNSDLQTWSQLMMHYFSHEAPVDYQHSVSGITALMVAAYHGRMDYLENLFCLGANPMIKCKNNMRAIDFALQNGNEDVASMLYMFAQNENYQNPQMQMDEANNTGKLLKAYDMCTPEELIDYNLIVEIIFLIIKSFRPGAILVFLPGYDDIMQCNDRIMDSKIPRDSYKIFFLHGSMSIQDQHGVFKHLPMNRRKIILATNIAETSLTIDDVVYVIDSGKAKEKTYDSYSGVGALQTQWISKSCIKQRTGRAGRTCEGFCFHLYTRQRYESFEMGRIPEILRTPLEELCLHTKAIIKNEIKIETFLEKAPNPPSSNAIKVAVESLQALGALDEQEQLTPLGEYLGQLTVEPHLGKMLIYSVVFKCLDPISTLVASMTYKDPFQLPPQANLRTKAAERRKSLTNDVLSDHLIYIKAFTEWQDHYPERQREFCQKYFINGSTMEMILMTRQQLIGQLKASGLVNTNASIADLNVYSNNWSLVKAIICCGLYPKIGFQIGKHIQTKSEKSVSVSNSSCLYKVCITNFWLMYDEMIKVKSTSTLRGITAFSPLMIPFLCGNEFALRSDNTYEIDNWLEMEAENAKWVLKFREIMFSIIAKFLRSPYTKLKNMELEAIGVLCKILTLEELAIKLKPAVNVGQRPKFMTPRSRYLQKNNFDRAHNVYDRNVGNQRHDNANGNQLMNGRVLNGHYNQIDRRANRKFNNRKEHVAHVPIAPNGPSTSYPLENERIYNLEVYNVPTVNPVFEGDDPHIVIRAMTQKNIDTAYKKCRWVCSAMTEKLLLKHELVGRAFFVFYQQHNDSLGGIAKLVNYEILEERRNLAVIQWIYKNVVPVSNCPKLSMWKNDRKAKNLGQLDGSLLSASVVHEIYEMMISPCASLT